MYSRFRLMRFRVKNDAHHVFGTVNPVKQDQIDSKHNKSVNIAEALGALKWKADLHSCP